jgi:hypothetical protein
MAGWRVGFMVGNRDLVGALARIKGYHDYGTFTPIQVAAIAALEGPQDCVGEICAKYQSRRDVLVKGLHEAGWMVDNPKASMYVWAKIPEHYRAAGSLEFTKKLLALTAVLMSQAPAFAAETILMGTTGRGSAQQWPIFIAQQKGYFAENGLTVDLIAAQSSSAVIQQLTAGSVNLASGGLADPLRAIDKGAPVTLLRVETQVPPYSIYGKPALKSLKDLKGKLISIGGVKDITRIYLERMMAPNGLKPNEYDLVFAGTASARFAALASGAVDATILVPPFSFQAEAAGFSTRR